MDEKITLELTRDEIETIISYFHIVEGEYHLTDKDKAFLNKLTESLK